MKFRKPSAESLDAKAAKLHETGKKVAGKPGGRVGDAIANTVLRPLRDPNHQCARRNCNHD